MKKNYVTSDKLSKMLFRVVLLALFFIPITLSWGQSGTYTAQTLPYSQNFSTLTGTSPAYPGGWGGGKVSSNAPSANGRTSNATDATLAVGIASSTSSGIFDFTGKIGFLSSSTNDNSVYLSIVTTGATKVGISFDAMTIRNPYDGSSNTYTNGLVLQYRVGTVTADPFIALPYSMTEYQNNTTTQTSGTTGQNIKVSLNATLPIACDNQAVVQIRWIYRNVTVSGITGGGTRCSMAIDNVSVGVSTSAITPLSYSPGDALSLPFIANGTYTGGFKAQLSDATGSFATPTDIGTTASNVSGTINATIPSGTVSGSSYRIRTVSINPSILGSDNGANITVAPLVNYYYVGSGALDVTTNWGTSTNGTGTNPPDFSSVGQIFNIVNTTSVATSAALWTVSGTGSKIVLGNSTAAITLTLVSGTQIIGPMNITAPSSGHHKIIYKNANTISVGTIADTGLEMVYDGATITTTTTRTYGDVSLINGAIIDMSGSNLVLQNLTIDATSTLSGAFTSSNYIAIKTGGSVTINGTFKTGRTNGLVSTNIAIPVVTNTLYNALLFQDTTESITIGPASTIVYNRGTTGNTGAQTIEARTYNNLTISNSVLASNKTFATGTLNVSGAFTVDNFLGALTQPSATTINYTGASAQTLPSVITAYSSLGISGAATKTVAAAATVSGVLTVGTGTTLATGNFLTLKSDANGTARVAEVLGSITGNVTVERYIPAKRAWRALTAPVKGSYNSIFNNWQNDGISGILTNTGVEIWSNAPTHVSVTTGGGASSMLSYNSSGNNWTPITDTSTAGSLFSASINNPFMVFVTGPYASTNINNASSAATTLRAKGSLIIGQQTYTTIPNKYTFIGNPYASPLSLSSMITSNNGSFEGNIWIWDANTTVANPVGIYNLYNNGAYTNVTSTPVAPTTEIQSGQAFFVRSTAGHSFIIEESNKGITNSVASIVFRDAAPAQLLRVGLYKQINTEWSGRDGAMTVILADANANQTPNKMANGTENVAFTKNSGLFASNHHLPFVASDVLNVKVWNTTVGANYKLKINTEQFATTSVNATLEDLFTNSRTPLTLDGSAVEYPFAVTTEATSTGNRFRIVFENSTLGINNPKATGISILPNPITGDAFQVNFGTLEMGTYSYSICNVLGQEVEKGNINNVAQNTNSVVKFKNNTAAGMYIMKVTGSDNSVFTAKIIKK